MKIPEILTRVMRAELTESIHRGHIAVVDAGGRLLSYLGCPETLIFARSAAKPLQAIPVVESGAMEKFGLNDQELAIVCASHNGEDEHTTTVSSILRKLQLNVDDLSCGIHYPYHKKTTSMMRASQVQPTPIHNNCSGKHSGMLALALAKAINHQHYAAVEHPVQQLMLQAVADMSMLSPGQIHLGVDGCGVPVFGLPLHHLALAYARLGDCSQLHETRRNACHSILHALRSYPSMIAGHDRFDTQLIEVTNGEIIGKMGAEGVFALTVPSASIGVAIKVEDGSLRGLYSAVIETLRQLNLLSSEQLAQLSEHARPAVLNRREEQVGSIEPCFTLHRTENH